MKQYTKITPEGTRDFIFEESVTRRSVEKKLSEAFLSHGYHEVMTPGLEFFDLFQMPGGEIDPTRLYKLTDKRGRLIVMRPDSTVPIARVVATRLQNQLLPLRLYYAQPVYTNTPGLDGKSDEILQSGIELIGASGLRADLEVIVTAIEALNRCVPDFRMELGHAGFFNAIAAHLEAEDTVVESIRLSIEAKNYPLLDTILDGLTPSPAVDAMRHLPRLFGGKEVFVEAEQYCLDDASRKTLDYVKQLFDALHGMNLGDKLMVDFGLVQRNDYYTDIVFSAYVEDFGDAVLKGGRYDKLFSAFDASMPAVGFGVNVDALTTVLLSHGRGARIPQVEILVYGEAGYELKALKHLQDMVAFGNSCEMSVFSTKEETLAYAKKRKIPRVDIVSDTLETIQIPLHREGGLL